MDEHATIADLKRRLAESETRHRLLVGSWAQAEWETDADGVVIADSPSWRAYTGQTLEEWLGHGWLDAIHPDDRAHAEQQWREAVAARGLVDAEFRLRAPDGGWRWTNVRAAPVLDAEGTIEKWVGINIDIDARKQAEAALRESEERYRSLFETMGQGYCEVELVRDANGRAVDQKYLEMNPALERLFGIPAAEVIGRRSSEIFPAHDPEWNAALDQVARTGTWTRIEGPLRDRWMEVFAYPRGGDRVTVLFEDASDRRRAVEALRESGERQAFLLKLSDALRPLANPLEIIGAAVRLLGEGVSASHTYYAEWPRGADYCEIRRDHAAPGLPSLVGRYPNDAFRIIYDRIRDGRTWVIDDVADGTIAVAERDYCLAHRVAAWVDVPLVKAGELQAALFLVQDAPRRWTATEIALAEGTAERTWAAAERARAETGLRESEEKYRTLFDTIDSGYALTDNVRDEEGRVVDLFGVDFNRSYTHHSGLPPFAGRRASEVITVQPEWLQQFEEVTRTGVPARHENYIAERDRWVSTHYSLVGDLGSDRVAVVFDDITDRKRAEAELRESEERQAFLLELSDALRPLADAGEMQATTARLLGTHLCVDRAMYAEVTGEPGAEAGVIRGQFIRPAAPGRPAPAPFPDHFTYESFGADVMARRYSGEGLAVADVNADPGFDAAERAAWARVGVQAAIVAPLVKGGRLVAELGVHSETARAWTDAEVSLVSEVGERTWAAVERARAEAAMRESEARLRTALSIGTVGVMFWSGDGSLVDVNDAFMTMTGFSRAEALGKTWRALTPPEFQERSERFVEEVETTGEGSPYEKQYYRRDGTRWWGLFAARKLGAGFVEFVLDVSDRHEAEAALAESEARLRLAVEAGGFGTFRWYPGEDRAEPDARTRALLGASSAREANLAEVLGKRLHPDDVALHTEAVARALDPAGDGRLSNEVRVVHPSGETRWVATTGQVRFGGDPPGALWMDGIAADVTERKEAEARLAESEERFRSFAEASSDTLWIIDAEAGRLEYLSPAFEPTWGEPRERIMADLGRWAELVHPDDRERARTGLPRLLAGEVLTQEYRIVRPSDGAVRWIRDTGFPIRDEAGRVRRVAGTAQDVTELKRIEAALQDSEGRLRTLMEGIPQLVWRSCDRGQWTWSSPQWCAFTGQSQEQSHGQGWLEAVHPDDHAATLAAWEAARPHGMLDVEYRVRRASDGAYLWHHTRSLSVRDEAGRIMEWLGTSTEVQQLKELQERQAVMVAELQHRTRNLIAVVRSIAQQTMAETGPGEAFQAAFSDRMAALSRVQGLLSRSESEPITIGQLIRLELDALGAAEAANRIVLDGPEVPLRNSVVQTLALAVHELATNARKYGALATEQGRLAVTWRVREADGAGRRLGLDWVEEGLDRAHEARSPASSGYGRELIERALPYALGARTRYELGEAGLRCTIDLPLGRREPRRPR